MRWILVSTIVALGAVLAGCGPTMTETASAAELRRQSQRDVEMRMLMDDIELLLLSERESRLTHWIEQ